MNLEEYIRQSYLRPNKQVLESLGASEELISYLRSTPWNTNIQVVDSIKEDGGGEVCTVTFDANGGSNPPEPITVPQNSQIEYPQDYPTPPINVGDFDVYFGGWTTEKNNLDTKVFKQIEELGDPEPLTVTSDITLYAYWNFQEVI